MRAAVFDSRLPFPRCVRFAITLPDMSDAERGRTFLQGVPVIGRWVLRPFLEVPALLSGKVGTGFPPGKGAS
jgi:hypothetical protein